MSEPTASPPSDPPDPLDSASARPDPGHAAHAIPGLRAMAVVRWLLLAAVAALAVGTWWTLVIHAGPPSTGAPRFYCPMHPQITSHDPGTCPICFMTLEPIPDERTMRVGAADAGGLAEEPVSAGDVPLGTAAVMLTTERRQVSGLATATARRIELGGERRWPAAVEAREGARAEVRVRASAFVERAQVRETGARVRRGQVLAWLYSPDVLRAQEELLAARRWPASAADGTLRTTEPIPEVEAAARRRLELLGASPADIDAIVADGHAHRTLPLRAPIAGVVTQYGAVLGAYAGPEDVLYEITDFARVRVVASVLEPADIALVATATAELIRRSDTLSVPLELELIEPTAETNARAVRVRFLAPNADGSLRPGDIGEVVAHLTPHAALVVPRDAVIDRGLLRYVFVDRGGGLFEARIVRAGRLVGEDREIVDGLAEGDRVVTRGAFVLDSESRLQAALAPAAGDPSAP